MILDGKSHLVAVNDGGTACDHGGMNVIVNVNQTSCDKKVEHNWDLPKRNEAGSVADRSNNSHSGILSLAGCLFKKDTLLEVVDETTVSGVITNSWYGMMRKQLRQ